MFKLKKKNNKRGFTLIELIVVIAILGILAAILVPTMLNVVGDAKAKVNAANARAIYSAAQSAYVQIATDGDAPAGTEAGTSYASTADDDIIKYTKQNLGSDLVDKEFSVLVGTNGVISVTHAGITYPSAEE